MKKGDPIPWKARHVDGREIIVMGVRWYDARASACEKFVCAEGDVHVSQAPRDVAEKRR